MECEGNFDYDWLIVGSGFGGSVSALRLAEKGYRVGVLECGKRYADSEHAKSAWDVRRFLWAPSIGCRGILRMTTFRDVFVLSGSAVGGGSIVYANTLYRARDEFYDNPQWAALADWGQELKPHYDTAEDMLAPVVPSFEGPTDFLLKDIARQFGVEDTFTNAPVAVYFGTPDVTVRDPYFGGAGPERTGCTLCGACMVGCRVGAKNTLVKNYLWFAEKKGAEILPEHQVVDIRALGAGDGSDGYEVITERPGAWINKQRRRFTTRGVVAAAGALGTNQLLANCKHSGGLRNISDQLGQLVRTNSEALLAVTLPDDSVPVWNSVAIGASIYTDPDTHIEFVTYGKGADAMGYLFTLLTGDGNRLTRPLLLLATILRHPLRFLRRLWPVGWARRSVIFLVMQSLDNAIAFKTKRRFFGRGVSLKTQQDPDKPNPTFIKAANEAAGWLAEQTGGVAQSMVTEAVANIPATAHILGGCAIGSDAGNGVVDSDHRLFGYQNFLVCDGAAMPANPGVNPSLTITAMAERAMSQVKAKGK